MRLCIKFEVEKKKKVPSGMFILFVEKYIFI